jgi:Prokaryotic homologs of the JAB domain
MTVIQMPDRYTLRKTLHSLPGHTQVVIRPGFRDFLDRAPIPDSIEHGGFCFGYHDGNEVVIEAAVTAEAYSDSSRVEFDLDALSDWEAHFDRANWRLIADWHSHVRHGVATPSETDLEAWIARCRAAGAGSADRPWAGLIFGDTGGKVAISAYSITVGADRHWRIYPANVIEEVEPTPLRSARSA